MSGEENAVTPVSWSETNLTTILSKYKLRDIYNADEFGLFYQVLPNKFLNHKVERCSGGHSKAKLTGLAAGNATGENYPYL